MEMADKVSGYLCVICIIIRLAHKTHFITTKTIYFYELIKSGCLYLQKNDNEEKISIVMSISRKNDYICR